MPGNKLNLEVSINRLDDPTSLEKWSEDLITTLSDLLFELIYNLNEVIDGKFNQLQMTVLNEEPTDVSDGWIVYADGTNWNPGSGRGLYERRSGSWIKL